MTVLVAIGVLLSIPTSAQAFNVYDTSGTSVVSVIPDEVYKARMDAWKRWVTSPREVFAPGSVIVSDNGLNVYICPLIVSMGCVLPMD